MTRKGRGWHGESARHAAAARGIPTVLERIRPKMDVLVDTTSWISSYGFVGVNESLLALYERNVEDMLVIFETNLKPEDLSIQTTGSTVGEELRRTRESYEASFSRTGTSRFLALEAARERLHSIAHALHEEYIL